MEWYSIVIIFLIAGYPVVFWNMYKQEKRYREFVETFHSLMCDIGQGKCNVKYEESEDGDSRIRLVKVD